EGDYLRLPFVVDFVRRVRGLVIVLVPPAEEEEDRNLLRVKRRMVARPEAVLAQLQRESVIKALDQLAEFWRRADAADRQLVLSHPPDHIQVDHRRCVGERRGRIVDVSLRTDQPRFFGAECDEDEAAAKPAALAAEYAREFEQAGRPRSVVV